MGASVRPPRPHQIAQGECGHDQNAGPEDRNRKSDDQGTAMRAEKPKVVVPIGIVHAHALNAQFSRRRMSDARAIAR